MALYVNTNTEAIIAQNNLTNTTNSLNTAMTQLSSGLRINTAADNAAGYAISADLTAQVNGLNQSTNNAQDATSLVQTADGALNDVQMMLQRIRELAVQYNGGTLSSTDQNAIISEVTQLVCQIEQIGTQAQFNGISLFTTSGYATSAIQTQGGINYTLLTFQVGANDGETISVSLVQLTGGAGLLNDIEKLTAGSGGFTLGNVGTTGLGALSLISSMIDQVSSLAADFGAIQNRLTYTLNNLSTYSENLTAAQSTITNVDMAAAMTQFTKDQILQQAGISMLSQAEQNPQAILKLLGA